MLNVQGCDCEIWAGGWECYNGSHKCTDCKSWLNRDHDLHYECDICNGAPVPTSDGFVTKDSGKRAEYDSGMVRDTQDGKSRFDLLIPRDIPYRNQFLTRVADLLGRGAEKYSDRNWESANGSEELDRFKSSAHRHLMQWLTGEGDEDHAAAVCFNLMAYESIKWKMEHPD